MATVPPEKDQDLEDWSGNWSAQIAISPTSIDLTAAQATAYAAAQVAYAAARAVAIDPLTRTKSSIASKDALKASLILISRQQVAQVNACATLSAAKRVDLRMNPARPSHVTPIPVPSSRPMVSVDNLGRVLLTDEHTPTLRRKPHGVDGAFLFTAITDVDAPAPAGPNDGTLFAALATASTHQLVIPSGSKGRTLWVFAQWKNPKGQPGPVGAPASVMIAA